MKGVPDSESVADHSFRVAFMTLLLADKIGVDKDKCVKMALIHDVAEVTVGDITPHDDVEIKKKYDLEKDALKKIFLEEHKELFYLWEEYAERKTPEARFVYEIDKLEMLLQAFEYRERHKGKEIDLTEFWRHVEERVEDPQLIKIMKLLK